MGAVIVNTLRYNYIETCFSNNHLSGFLLDIGCGRKPYKKIYKKYVTKSIGIEMEDTPNINSSVDLYYDGKHIPFKAQTFDIVLCTEVLEHVPNFDEFLSEIYRVLKKGGHLIITTPFFQLLHETPHDYYRYTPFGLKVILERNSFIIMNIVGFSNTIGFIITYFVRFPLKIFNKLTKLIKIKFFNTPYNPLLFIFVLLPQILFLILYRSFQINDLGQIKNNSSYGILLKK